MSTRATVWIRSEKDDISRYLYHHCNGYMLDEELEPILKDLQDNDWFIPDIIEAITNYDSAYRENDEIGWDSEYVYKIDVDKRTLTKYECGCWFHGEHVNDSMSIEEEKTQHKYIVKTYEFNTKGEDLPFGDSQEEAHRKVEKIKDIAFNIKKLIDWSVGISGLDDEGKVAVVSLLFGMYHGDNSI